MLAIPAIDLHDGSCVRLVQGDFARCTSYSDDPAKQAAIFVQAGAARIHVVDLDGARTGGTQNAQAIRAIVDQAAAANVQVQLGGGLRSKDAVSLVLASGVDYAIMGSAAIYDFDLFAELCNLYPNRILLGLDANAGKLAAAGWTELAQGSVTELAQRAEQVGCAGIIHTEIQRDGMLGGIGLASTKSVANAVSCPVYASGGFSSLSELDDLAQLGLAGVIIGTALYNGSIECAAAVDYARELAA